MDITTDSPGTGRFASVASAATVTDSTRLSERLVQIRMQTKPSHRPFQPGDKVKLAVPGGRPKSYTPARMTSEALDVIFELHGQGPTALWAAQARPGDSLWTTGALPSLTVQPGALWFVGDATSLGLAVALHHDPRYQLHGVIELQAHDAPAVERLGLPLTAVLRGEACTQTPKEGTCAVICGEAGLVATAHQTLRESGMPTLAKPYWSLRGVEHRKRVAMATRA